MKVNTSYAGCSYITAGKVYNVEQNGIEELIIDDEGDTISIIGPSWDSTCPHLNNEGYWELVE